VIAGLRAGRAVAGPCRDRMRGSDQRGRSSAALGSTVGRTDPACPRRRLGGAPTNVAGFSFRGRGVVLEASRHHASTGVVRGPRTGEDLVLLRSELRPRFGRLCRAHAFHGVKRRPLLDSAVPTANGGDRVPKTSRAADGGEASPLRHHGLRGVAGGRCDPIVPGIDRATIPLAVVRHRPASPLGLMRVERSDPRLPAARARPRAENEPHLAFAVPGTIRRGGFDESPESSGTRFWPPLAASAAHAPRRAQARAQVTAADARQRSDPDRRIFLAASRSAGAPRRPGRRRRGNAMVTPMRFTGGTFGMVRLRRGGRRRPPVVSIAVGAAPGRRRQRGAVHGCGSESRAARPSGAAADSAASRQGEPLRLKMGASHHDHGLTMGSSKSYGVHAAPLAAPGSSAHRVPATREALR
jgi:hypothetical protein